MPSHICPLCGGTTGDYAELDNRRTAVGGNISIKFWLCYVCSKATAIHPEVLDNLSHEEFSWLYDYFQTREYTLYKKQRRREIVEEPTLVGASHV